jgi:hypothetical protein
MRASIKVAALAGCLDRWASFHVAALVLEVWADDRAGADARVNYVGGSLESLETLAAAALCR